MNLIERNLGLNVELKENVVSVIVVEKASSRLSVIGELYSGVMGSDGSWMLAENEKKFDLSKKAEMILEPFSLKFNNKKIKLKLYQDIKSFAQDFYFSQSLELHMAICNYLENLLEEIPYPVKYDEEWDIAEILNAYGVEIAEECDDMCEKLFEYIKIVNHACGIGIFILVNIKQYLTENQIDELYKLAMYSKIQLVLIEFSMSKEKLPCEDVYILDKDGCIITY